MTGGTRRTDASPPRVWALLGPRRGDNDQVLALARGLGVAFEEKRLGYTALRLLPSALLGATLATLDRPSREQLRGHPPDLVIAIGNRSVPVVRWLKRRNPPAVAVQLGNPRVSPNAFDLVVTTGQYDVPDAPNVMRLPVVLTVDTRIGITPFENSHHRPRRLLIVGGPTTFWRLDHDALGSALKAMDNASLVDGGTVWIATSRRTDPKTQAFIAANAGGARIFRPTEASLNSLLAAADAISVTADSAAMMSQSLMSGKPVAVVPVRPTLLGQAWMRASRVVRPGRPVFPRDLRRFWKELHDNGWNGTVDQPQSFRLANPIGDVVQRIRALLEERGFSL